MFSRDKPNICFLQHHVEMTQPAIKLVCLDTYYAGRTKEDLVWTSLLT